MEEAMRSYRHIQTQEDMNHLIASIAGFHDSMTKEIHLINRGYVQPDKSMVMNQRLDAQVLIQSQWDPFALEILLIDVQKLSLHDATEYWGGFGIVEFISDPVKKTQIHMSFDKNFKFVCTQLFYAIRKDWLGQKTFLKSEVPSPDAVPATVIEDNWRQCSGCSDAWQEELREEFSFCPSCGLLTQLVTNSGT